MLSTEEPTKGDTSNGAGPGHSAASQDSIDAEGSVERIDTVIIGSGFSGLAMAQRMKKAGLGDFIVLEKAASVGGTWRENTYPGCACDVPSHVYSFSFALNPEWTSTFSHQPEIKAYIERTADEHGLTPHVRFGVELTSAEWDPGEQRWNLETSTGPISARVLIASSGPLHEPKLPDVRGIETFEGEAFHSAKWDHSVDLKGKRVAVVGTGASSIQFVPKIQPEVEQMYVFQRTAPWIVPRTDRPITSAERFLFRHVPGAQRAMRTAVYWAREGFAIPMLRAKLSKITRRLATKHIASQVSDPELRRKVTPDYAPGCKRILISNTYYPAIQKPNGELVTDGIVEVRPHSVVTASGEELAVDTIIFGTGFHVTDLPIATKIRDGEGVSIAEHAGGSPQAFRGSTFPGFPNLFLLLGPNTGLGHMSVVFMAEAQADYVTGALRRMRSEGIAAVEVRREAWAAYNEKIQRDLEGTVWNDGGCASWYMDANGRNTTLWPDFAFRFRQGLREFDIGAYDCLPYRAATPTAGGREAVAA
ncbi:NAD(P)/FAD-dependent oxidoreductase [soil metagenome]